MLEVEPTGTSAESSGSDSKQWSILVPEPDATKAEAGAAVEPSSTGAERSGGQFYNAGPPPPPPGQLLEPPKPEAGAAESNEHKTHASFALLWRDLRAAHDRELEDLRRELSGLRRLSNLSHASSAPAPDGADTIEPRPPKKLEPKPPKGSCISLQSGRSCDPTRSIATKAASLQVPVSVQKSETEDSPKVRSSWRGSRAVGAAMNDIVKKAGLARLTRGLTRGGRQSWKLRDVNIWSFDLNAMVTHPLFEMTFCVLIGINAMVLAAEVQYSGLDIGHTLEWRGCQREAADIWPGAQGLFFWLDVFFGVLFALEIVIKIVGLRAKFWCEAWNLIDLSIVCLWTLEAVGSNIDLPFDAKAVRLARAARAIRMLRLVKQVQAFESLYVMTTAIKASGVVLGWACILLFLVQMLLALLMNQVLHFTYFADTGQPLEEQQAVYEYFGTFTRAMLSMFEITLANWPPVCRLVSELVSEWYVIFFIAHKLFIGFAIVGVINGVFMQETFSVASSDDRIMMNQKERQIQQHIQKMTLLYQHSDVNGDGLLDREEWSLVASDATVQLWLRAMGIEGLEDTNTIFDLIDNGDGALTIEELIRGLSRLKGDARSVDLVTLMREHRDLQKAFDIKVTSKRRNRRSLGKESKIQTRGKKQGQQNLSTPESQRSTLHSMQSTHTDASIVLLKEGTDQTPRADRDSRSSKGSKALRSASRDLPFLDSPTGYRKQKTSDKKLAWNSA